MAKKEKDKTRNDYIKQYKNEIPDDIRILFGKFYVFSFIYLIFFLIIYPFILIKSFSLINLVLIISFLTIFYLFIVIDVIKKKKQFRSNLFILLIILVFIAISFSIVKFWF